MATLRDLGERAIVSNILPKFCSPAGDDCALVALNGRDLVLTTDPVPDPAAHVIGGDGDLYWMGHLLVTINASDLAAAGAHPLAFLSAIECPPELEVDRFERLLQGIGDACIAENLRYVGGNLKESSKVAATGTAVGVCERGKALHRRGAKNGDLLLSIGRGGIFWRDAIALRRGATIRDKTASPVFRPLSQIKNMEILANHIPISVAMDNSDGLLATAAQLATINHLSIIIDLDKLSVPDSGFLELDSARLWLGWGDWNILIAVSPDHEPSVVELAGRHGFFVSTIGEFKDGFAGAFVRRKDKIQEAPRLESERFAADSWFSSGINGYIKMLLELDLP
jgi:thiamine-monophosphate kinase